MDIQGVVVDDYMARIEVYRARYVELGLSLAGLDQLVGWTDTYATKVLGLNPIKRMSPGMEYMLIQALALKMVLLPDAEAEERIKNHGLYEHRKFMLCAAEHNPIVLRFSRRHYRRIQKESRKAYMRSKAAKRRRIARNAAVIRWDKVRAAARGI